MTSDWSSATTRLPVVTAVSRSAVTEFTRRPSVREIEL